MQDPGEEMDKTSDQLPVTSYQLPVTSYQLPVELNGCAGTATASAELYLVSGGCAGVVVG